MTSKFALLAPRPQDLLHGEGELILSQELTIFVHGEPPSMLFAAQWLQRALGDHEIAAAISARPGAGSGDILLAVDETLCPRPQSYRLLVEPSGITITGGDNAGLFYGVCTLCQLVELHARAGGPLTLPALVVEDWPDYPNRGVMLDICRDRVPTMQTLYELVDLLASLKVNQLQLYIEHTFAYAGHEVVWQHASPITGEEALLLDAFCRERHVELVPNQNSFGHMHRWLKHDAYRPLAESPEGIQHPFTPVKEPYSFCPVDPGSLGLLADLYDQLLPHFSSRQFNVGLDETFDLGLGRSKAICEEKGVGAVYLDFLIQIHELVRRHGHTMQFWSDIIVRDEPELVASLPRDVIALEWGYEAGYPFAEHAELIAKSGRAFYVCPGTSSWNALAGRTDNALGNLSNAAISGFRHGAIGYLTTDWGDNGHMQPLPVSYLGYLAGAAMSWNVATASADEEPDWASMLDAHLFRDEAGVMGRLAYDMGLAYRRAGAEIHNSSPLFWLSILPDALPANRFPPATTAAQLDEAEAYIAAVMAQAAQAKMRRADAGLVTSEFQWVAAMLTWACHLGIARLKAGIDRPVEQIDSATKRALAEELAPLIGRHRELWLQRSRPGGLDDSAARLERMLARLGGPSAA